MNFASAVIYVADQKIEPVLSKAQKQFNKLIQRIEHEKDKLLAWKNTIPSYQHKHGLEFLPLMQNLNKIQAEKVRLLDCAISAGGYGKQEKQKLRDLICRILKDVMEPEDKHGLKEIYNKYTKSDLDSEVESEKEMLKAMMAEEFGIEFEEDFDLKSPQEVMARMLKELQKKRAQEEQEEINRPQGPQKKKSAKAAARENKQKQEEEEVSQSIKEVFRKLAVALHPDKEQDSTERDRKTELMKRVNEAYKSRDLLQLLELQLEIEQIDQKMLNALSADRLKTYNRILNEQLASMQQEVDAIEFEFKMRFMLPPEFRLVPASLLPGLQFDIESLRSSIALANSEVNIFQDKTKLKNWLRSYRIYSDDDFCWDMRF